jgi:hypothetical protein
MSGGPRGLGAGLIAAAIAACALLAGCGNMQSVEVAEPVPPKAPAPRPSRPPRQVSDAETLISYFAQLRKLPGPELAREHDAARQAYGLAPSDYNRMRLAMTITLPNSPFFDEPHALDLLEPLARNAEAQLSGLAFLLVSQIQERRRLDANAQALQQKLDALKSLERSLIERKR